MRTLILAAAAVVASAGVLSADVVDLNFHAGYTSFAMGTLNKSNAYLNGWEAVDHADLLDSGFVVGVDEGSRRFTPWDALELGLREEYLQSNSAEMKSLTGTYPDRLDFTDQATLTNVLVGAKLDTPFLDSALTLGWGAWIGYGYAALDQNVRYNGNPASIQAGLFSSMLLVGELESSATYRIGSHIGLTFTGGWRWADAPSLSSHGTPLYDNYQYWLNGKDHRENVDFSGATAQGAVNVYF